MTHAATPLATRPDEPPEAPPGSADGPPRRRAARARANVALIGALVRVEKRTFADRGRRSRRVRRVHRALELRHPVGGRQRDPAAVRRGLRRRRHGAHGHRPGRRHRADPCGGHRAASPVRLEDPVAGRPALLRLRSSIATSASRSRGIAVVPAAIWWRVARSTPRASSACSHRSRSPPARS